MVRLVVEDGWSVSAAAHRFQVDDKTVRKWCGRWRAEGVAGLRDRSSRPRHSPRRTPEPQRRKVIETRRRTRRGAGFIAHVLDMHSSTVHRICVAEGLGRLDRGDRSTGPPPKPLRYQRENPGELVHVDIKKLPAIPDGGGWRTHGRGNARPRQRAGWRYVHTAIDDRTRLGYSEIHSNETGPPPQGSGDAPPPSAPSTGSPARESSQTTAAATAPTTSAKRSKTPAPAPGAPAPTGPRPTAKSSASTASSTKNGPTPETGPQTPNAAKPTKHS